MDTSPSQPISREEARASLQDIDRTLRNLRGTLAKGAGAPLLIIWGAIWCVGFTLTQYWPQAVWHWWLALDAVGFALSFTVGAWSGRSPLKDPIQPRIALSWMIWLIFTMLAMFLVVPLDWRSVGPEYAHTLLRRMSAYWCCNAMFAYVIMGLWLSRFLLWLGLFVTAAILAEYFMVKDYFFLAVAFTGGGALIVTGLIIRLSWR